MAMIMMSQSLVMILLLCVVFMYEAGTANSSAIKTSFIRTSCEVTTYKAVCVKSLVGYASVIQQSQRQLVQTALAVSLVRAEATRTFMRNMTKLRGVIIRGKEHEAIGDCLEEIGDSVDRIRQSIQEMKAMGKQGESRSQSQSQDEFFWHMSNVQTWVSTALTDYATCMDGFSDRDFNPKIKASIRDRVTNVAQLTSNALALINHFYAHF